MDEFDEMRRDDDVISNVPDDVFGPGLADAHVKDVGCVACAGAHAVEREQIAAEVCGGTVKGNEFRVLKIT